jgi:hypothetical protein
MQLALIHSLTHLAVSTSWTAATAAPLRQLTLLRASHAGFIVALCPSVAGTAWASEAAGFPVEMDRPRWRVDVQVHNEHGVPRSELAVTPAWLHPVAVEGGERYYDALDPSPVRTLAADQPAYLHISVAASQTARPGSAVVRIQILESILFGPEQLAAESTLLLMVSPVCVAPPHEWQFLLDLWQHPSNLARHYGVVPWSEPHWELLKTWLAEMARLGQKVLTAVVSEAPWGGHRECDHIPLDSRIAMDEYSIVPLCKPAGSTRLVADFSLLRRYLDLGVNVGIDQELNLIGLLGCWPGNFGGPLAAYPDCVRLRFYDEATGTFRFATDAADLSHLVWDLREFLDREGWLSRTCLLLDEPKKPEVFRAASALVRAAWPGVRFKIAVCHREFMSAAPPELDYWVFYLSTRNMLDDPDAVVRKLQAAGGTCNWYVCCFPASPNTFVFSPPVEARLLPWLSARMGMAGLLRWSAFLWPRHPWECATYNTPDWPDGDLFLLYPGATGRPVPSRRWEGLYQGIVDFELVQRAATKLATLPSASPQLESIMATLMTPRTLTEIEVDNKQPATWYALDTATYDAAREAVLALLD